MKITGTFLDEITADIPSNNWSRELWSRDFAAMKHIGIDTVIIIRAGLRNRAIFNSDVLRKSVDAMPAYRDLAAMFLELAEENSMRLYFGTYDSDMFWKDGNLKRELDVNKDFVEEIWEKYGSYKAFNGWYMSHEFGRKNAAVECVRQLADHCKKISGQLPVLVSPYMWGKKLFQDKAITLEEHQKEWDDILSVFKGGIDIVAFQDGHVDYEVLKDYIAVNKELINKYGMSIWSNIESFDRDMPFNFPPIDWEKMWWKLCIAEKAGVDKCITFEFSHFMSPHSMWPSAANLYDMYCNHSAIEKY